MKTRSSSILLLTLFLFSQAAFSADQTFEYPELSVVPRASDRLLEEAKRDAELGWKVQLPLLVPATMSIVSGAVLLGTGTRSDTELNNTGAKYAPWVGIGVGAAWWALSLTVLDNSSGYTEGAAEVAAMPKGTQREQLARERRAEEVIYHAGSLARRLKWISFGSNLASGIYMASSAKKENLGLYVAVASAVTALTPILFPHRWSEVESFHRDYKKRIYAPVVGATFLQDPSGKSLMPGLSLALQF